jgi:hypothetical protein
LNFFNLPNPFSRTTAQGFTQPLTEMSTRRYLWGKARPARKADNLNAIYKPIDKIWDRQHLTALQACTACYKDSFTFLLVLILSLFHVFVV